MAADPRRPIVRRTHRARFAEHLHHPHGAEPICIGLRDQTGTRRLFPSDGETRGLAGRNAGHPRWPDYRPGLELDAAGVGAARRQPGFTARRWSGRAGAGCSLAGSVGRRDQHQCNGSRTWAFGHAELDRAGAYAQLVVRRMAGTSTGLFEQAGCRQRGIRSSGSRTRRRHDPRRPGFRRHECDDSAHQ